MAQRSTYSYQQDLRPQPASSPRLHSPIGSPARAVTVVFLPGGKTIFIFLSHNILINLPSYSHSLEYKTLPPGYYLGDRVRSEHSSPHVKGGEILHRREPSARRVFDLCVLSLSRAPLCLALLAKALPAYEGGVLPPPSPTKTSITPVSTSPLRRALHPKF